jgi:hypothetical protein
MRATKLIIGGLSSLDEEELREALGEEVEFDEPAVPEGTLAEPATITAIITLGSLAIAALATYLSKGRRSYLHKETFRIQHPDGRIEERTLEVRAASEEEAKAQIMAQISKWTGQTA